MAGGPSLIENISDLPSDSAARHEKLDRLSDDFPGGELTALLSGALLARPRGEQ
jgi:hypothetical protein